MVESTVFCMGACGIDQISVVQKYPNRDEKIRATSFSTQGGGNAANTATAISRLCGTIHDDSGTSNDVKVRVGVLTKLGGSNDPTAAQLIDELNRDAIDTSFVFRALHADTPSPQTYVINDKETNSRTCIHVPMIEEVTPQDVDTIAFELLSAQFIHFDSRHPLGAVHLANKAIQERVPISLDIEKYRLGATELLELSDIIFTNEKFPSLFKEENNAVFEKYLHVHSLPSSISFESIPTETILSMLGMLQVGRASIIVTTFGSNGAVLLKRKDDKTWSQIKSKICPSSSSMQVMPPSIFDSVNFNVESQIFTTTGSLFTKNNREEDQVDEGCTYELLRCPTWPYDQRPIVDSTGAGDSFIGGFISGLLHGFCEKTCMKLASLVASEKLRGLGARGNLPTSKAITDIITSATSYKLL